MDFLYKKNLRFKLEYVENNYRVIKFNWIFLMYYFSVI